MRIRTMVVVAVAGSLLAATPAVATGTFDDDDGSIYEPSIEAIAAAGITKGCNPPVNDQFCPGDRVTRGQMAAFLSRALFLAAAPGDRFRDDDDSVFEADIEALAAAGITKGCNPPVNDRFCPNDAVTRGQMAAFLVRALGYSDDGGGDLFADDDGSVFEGDIDRIGAAGVTRGCNPPTNDRFCPEDLVTREQMAAFLARALGLSAVDSVTFAAGGDFGATSLTDATFASMAASDAEFLLALGDLAYADLTETEWCDYVKSYLGSTFPVELVVGNHEDDSRVNGYIGNFAACLPDRMGSTGTYAAEYYFDVDQLARFIMIGADNEVGGESYDYDVGSSHYQWLEAAIDDARASGIDWVIVGIHKPCLTAGVKSCEIGGDVYDLLVDKRVDLILHGHEHNYQRSKQLTCATPGTYRPECVADDGSDDRYTKGAGSVFVIVGNAGGNDMYSIDGSDPELGYLVTWLGANSPDAGRGYALMTVTPEQLQLSFVGSTTTYSDSFVIEAS
jgi:3',5'-cyclic AMP phosphodiesterase CpdA